jgi:hypothetical protein
LILLSRVTINGTGSFGANRITGSAGTNIFSGLPGDDPLDGGTGDNMQERRATTPQGGRNHRQGN